jgi:hypothetical protein
MAFGLSAGAIGLIGAGAGLVGGAMSAGAARDAAGAQAGAAAASDATQRYQYDTTRADNAPFRETGLQANNRLAYLMGLGGSGGASSGGTAGGGYPASAPIRNPSPAQYTTPGSNVDAELARYGLTRQMIAEMDHPETYASLLAGTPASANAPGSMGEADRTFTIDPVRSGQQFTKTAPADDPSFGSLTRRFSASDMAADPVYNSGLQFGLDQGTQGINRQAAAGGSMLSGATLKALTRFGNDYGSTKANESYNRFNTDQNSQYNKLAGLSGAGQQATNQVSAAGQNMANNISQSQQGVGNARGSAYLSQGNAWQNALNGGVSALRNGMGGGNSLYGGSGMSGGGGFGTGSAFGNQDYGINF